MVCQPRLPLKVLREKREEQPHVQPRQFRRELEPSIQEFCETSLEMCSAITDKFGIAHLSFLDLSVSVSIQRKCRAEVKHPPGCHSVLLQHNAIWDMNNIPIHSSEILGICVAIVCKVVGAIFDISLTASTV
jgi:hypothetical protein